MINIDIYLIEYAIICYVLASKTIATFSYRCLDSIVKRIVMQNMYFKANMFNRMKKIILMVYCLLFIYPIIIIFFCNFDHSFENSVLSITGMFEVYNRVKTIIVFTD